MSVEKYQKNKRNIDCGVASSEAFMGNPQHGSTFGIIFQVHHSQQMTTVVGMTKNGAVKKETKPVLGDFSANLDVRCEKTGNIVSL